jgi:hypothetical protein
MISGGAWGKPKRRFLFCESFYRLEIKKIMLFVKINFGQTVAIQQRIW